MSISAIRDLCSLVALDSLFKHCPGGLPRSSWRAETSATPTSRISSVTSWPNTRYKTSHCNRRGQPCSQSGARLFLIGATRRKLTWSFSDFQAVRFDEPQQNVPILHAQRTPGELEDTVVLVEAALNALGAQG